MGNRPMKCPKCQTDNPETQKFCGECATPLTASGDAQSSFTKTLETPVEALTRGTVFADRYEIIEELGKGGMGAVYRVDDIKAKEEVALKLIKPEIAADKKTIERFRNELTTARMIAHRNVCKMFDLGEEKGTHYITMEYVPGEDLKSFIRRSKRLSIPSTVSIAKQICEGLSEAHNLGIVHRDLKPSNIMIDKDGNARIMDFGIARSLIAKGLTGEGVMIGTPEYMSPEQAEAKAVDHRSDIYSLGVVLYEMVTGRLPFDGDTPLSMALKHTSETPKDPKEFNPQIPDDLSKLILKCLEKDKDIRYPSTRQVWSELEDVEMGIPTTGRVLHKKKLKTKSTVELKWKNIFIYGGAAILLVSLVVCGLYLLIESGEAMDSIAVLPFENVNANPETEYLSDGITESVINKLSQLPGLKKVIARGSVFRYKGTKIDPQAVGQELDVDVVLMSQMNQLGNELSISVELINVRDNKHIWGSKYRRDLSEIFAVEDEISNSITENLKLRLTNEELERVVKRHTKSTEAYKAYLKGKFYWNKRTKEGMERSIEYFRQAIKEDPTYAPAHSALAGTYSTLGSWGVIAPKVAFSRAREATLKALELDDLLAEAHSAIAGIKSDFEWDWEGAERGFKRAIELNPNYASAHQWYGEYLTYMGRFDEAIAEFKRAQELDPLSLIINAAIGWVYYFEGRYDQSIQQCRKTLEMDSDFYPANIYLGWNYIAKGMYNEAIEVSQKAVARSGGSALGVSALIISYDGLSMPDKAKESLDSLLEKAKEEYVSPFHIAMTYSALKEKDKAFEWLEKSYEEHFVKTVFLKYGRWFDSLRSDPRFKAFLKKVNLE
jgi:serine/threonine protein kinase/Tfp pilus assembly protein PilF